MTALASQEVTSSHPTQQGGDSTTQRGNGVSTCATTTAAPGSSGYSQATDGPGRVPPCSIRAPHTPAPAGIALPAGPGQPAEEVTACPTPTTSTPTGGDDPGPLTPAAVLLRAADLIEEHGWTQDYYCDPAGAICAATAIWRFIALTVAGITQ